MWRLFPAGLMCWAWLKFHLSSFVPPPSVGRFRQLWLACSPACMGIAILRFTVSFCIAIMNSSTICYRYRPLTCAHSSIGHFESLRHRDVTYNVSATCPLHRVMLSSKSRQSTRQMDRSSPHFAISNAWKKGIFAPDPAHGGRM